MASTLTNHARSKSWVGSLAILAIGLCLTLFASPIRASIAESDEASTGSLRLLSLTPSVTEMLFALGLGDQVVGVTDFCNYPPAARQKPRVGGLFDPNIEMMLRLDPDLAIAAFVGDETLNRLAGAGIEVLTLPSETIDDVKQDILKLGQRLGTEPRALVLVARIEQGLAEIERRNADRESPTVLYVIGHPPGVLRDIYAAGPSTFLDEMLEAAGARNAMADSPSRYPLVSREFLMRHPPDLIVDTKPDGSPMSEDEKTSLIGQWKTMLGPRGENTRIVILDDPRMTIPGPGLVDSALKLERLIHGDPKQSDHD